MRIHQNVINCTNCVELNTYCKAIAQKKTKRFINDTYWGKPVPAFGNITANLLIIGLAPAAHGANRTGRMFTGDNSGDWLFKALYETGFANQANSNNVNDGLELYNCFIASIIHCAPPKNKPTTTQINNCSVYLVDYINQLSNLKVVLTLGGIAFKNYCKLYDIKSVKFGHNKVHQIKNKPTLISSYHPSKYNTQTKRLVWEDWLSVFKGIKQLVN